MLAVVQLHDLCVDVGLQGAIVVGQVRQRVLLPRCRNLVYSLAEAGSTSEDMKNGLKHTSTINNNKNIYIYS